jgi:nicotinamide mononucleotide transporter
MDLDQILEIAGTIVGLFYLYYEYKASMKVWIAGIIMPAISLFVYFRHGLYADFGINIYYLLAAIYGWMVWKYGKKKEEKFLPITHTPKKLYPVLVLVFVLAFLGIGYILVNYTDSNVPWWDSFTTALSIVGMWMLARKWLEQWISWILVDAVSCGLYIYKEVYFYAGLYGLYTIIAIFGYLEWKRKMKETR